MLIYRLMYFSLLVVVLCLSCFVMHYFVGCFAIIVLQIYCYCKCSLTIPHGAVGWSAVCDCVIS